MKTEEEQATAIAEAAQAEQDNERLRATQLKTQFPDDAEFVLKAITEGWTLAEAKAEYCDVLEARLADSKKREEAATAAAGQRVEGADALETGSGGADAESTSGDFIAEARELAAANKISVTAAMKQLARTKPDLHNAFLERSATSGRQMYAAAI